MAVNDNAHYLNGRVVLTSIAGKPRSYKKQLS